MESKSLPQDRTCIQSLTTSAATVRHSPPRPPGGRLRADGRSNRRPACWRWRSRAACFARRARLLTASGRPRPAGRPERGRRPARRAGDRQVLGQRKLFQRALPGLMHACIFWGFLVLLTTIVEAVGQVDRSRLRAPARSATPAGWGCCRTCSRPWCSSGSRSPSGSGSCSGPSGSSGSHRLRRVPDPRPDHVDHPHAVPAARRADRARRRRVPDRVDAGLDRGLAAVHVDERRAGSAFFAWIFLWAHLALVLGFLVYLPYSKHLHIVTSAINVWFASTRPRGALEPLRIDMEKLETGEQSLGAADAAPTSRARSCWTSTPAPSAAAARASALHGTRASRSPRSS